MNNPHAKPKNYAYYFDEKEYDRQHKWEDMDELRLDVEGLHLIICTINISTGYSANVGFRLVDGSDNPLMPLRKSSNSRIPAHFSVEPYVLNTEDHTPVTFHMVAYCNVVRLQIRVVDAGGRVRINAAPTHNPPTDAVWNNKPMSTMSAIPLCPMYQPGANKVFSYSRRSPRGVQEKSKSSQP
jgi:hypothetical protein